MPSNPTEIVVVYAMHIFEQLILYGDVVVLWQRGVVFFHDGSDFLTHVVAPAVPAPIPVARGACPSRSHSACPSTRLPASGSGRPSVEDLLVLEFHISSILSLVLCHDIVVVHANISGKEKPSCRRSDYGFCPSSLEGVPESRIRP